MLDNLKLKLTRVANRYYRVAKTALITNKPPILTTLFFSAAGALDSILSDRRLDSAQIAAKVLWKQNYHRYFAEHKDQLLALKTEFPVAISSDDHKHPRGTLFDNSVNPRFNAGVYRLLGYPKSIKFLDLGCAGGGLVKSFIEDGHSAIGVEGSDISRQLRSGEWDTIPFHLFACDITKPFCVVDAEEAPVLFDVVTAWEVLEHIPEEFLAGLISNIHNHLRTNGYFFCSIDLLPDGNPITGAVYHKTLKSASWWEQQFTEFGFLKVSDHGFATRDMVRGNGSSLKDWHPDDGGGIHLVMQKPDRN